MYACCKNVIVPDDCESVLYWIQLYYNVKYMKKIGITIRPDDFHPYDLELLCMIEREFRIMEAKELEKSSKSRVPRPSKR